MYNRSMKYIQTDFSIPYYNMALEEYLLTNEKFAGEEFLFFYIHSPSVIIGSHQNAYAEVNLKYVRENSVIVSRRLSGGGAVYHDSGNLNFSFILNKGNNELVDFKKHTAPVVEALCGLGLDVGLSGRNDILLDGRKISGNAEYVSKNKLLHHGTLLFDVNIENMLAALNVDELKITSKAIKSVASRVTNIKSYLPEGFDIFMLRERLRQSFGLGGNDSVYTLTKEDLAAVDRLVAEKFSLDAYNFGSKEKFSIVKKAKFPCGIVVVSLSVKNGLTEAAAVNGDFFTNRDIGQVERLLIGTPFSEEAYREKLASIGFDGYIVNFTGEELLSLIF